MYLLLQSRTDQSGWHEYKCMFTAAQVNYDKFMQVNIASEFVSSKEIERLMRKAKATIIGGLGEVGYGETDERKKLWFNSIRNKIIPVLKHVIDDQDIKILGVCFGHQLLAEALGTPVVYAAEQIEMGPTPVTLTKAGQQDTLFATMQTTFPAILAHKDAVIGLPKGTVHLAYSEKCPIQAFRYSKYVYGVQFHPDMDYADMQYRISLFPSYSENATTSTTPVDITTHAIIRNFLAL